VPAVSERGGTTAEERVVLGVHLADDSVRVARLEFSAGHASMVEAGVWPLPAHAVRDGVVSDRDLLAEVAAEVARWAGSVDEVRVALATSEQAVCRAAALDQDLSRGLADRWATISATSATDDDVVCGSVAVSGQLDRLVVAARRSSVARAADAMAPVGVPVAIDSLPLALLRIGPALLPAGHTPTAIRLRERSLCWDIDLPQLSVEVNPAKAFGAATDLTVLYRQGAPVWADQWPATVSMAEGLRGPAVLSQLAVAMGAALGGVDHIVGPLDLSLPEYRIPLDGDPGDEAGLTWLVERSGPIEVLRKDPMILASRRA
jgi:hypothetical protein